MAAEEWRHTFQFGESSLIHNRIRHDCYETREKTSAIMRNRSMCQPLTKSCGKANAAEQRRALRQNVALSKHVVHQKTVD
jgi:hypothetical protein